MRQTGKVSKCLHYCRTGTTSIMSHFGLCSLVVGYCIIGAFLFERLEADFELQKRKEVMAERGKLKDQLWHMTVSPAVLDHHNWTEHATTLLSNFTKQLVQAIRKDGYDGSEGHQLQWSFTGAMLYSIIVVTTIGYGNVAPRTAAGKIMTIFYAIFGIPLMLLCLSNIGDVMAQSFKLTYRYVCCGMRRRSKSRRPPHRVPPIRQQSLRGPPPDYHHLQVNTGSLPSSFQRHSNMSGDSRGCEYDRTSTTSGAAAAIISNRYVMNGDDGSRFEANWPLPPNEDGSIDSVETIADDDDDEVTVPIWLCCALVISYICAGAALFRAWETWSFLDSCYFCFVTLTTIGFGDLVPGAALKDDHQTTLAICAVYLLLGMALLAMSFNLVQEEVTKSVKNVGRRLGIVSDDDH